MPVQNTCEFHGCRTNVDGDYRVEFAEPDNETIQVCENHFTAMKDFATGGDMEADSV